MFGAILKATNSSFQKGMTFCRSVYVKKVMKLLAFISEQPSYSSIRLYKRIPSKANQVIHSYCVYFCVMRGSRNFRQVGPGQSDKEKL